MPGFFDIAIYVASFVFIWIGSGLIVSSINKLSHKFHIPTFLISFVILGLLTSTPEIAVGLSAVSSNTPGIFVGNLLGGVPVLFLFVIPFLAVFGRGIKLNHNLDQASILLSLASAGAPFLVVLDGKVSNPEGLSLIAIYLVVVFILYRKNSILNGKNHKLLSVKSYSFLDVLKVLLGTAIVLISSSVIVSKTIYFSQVFSIAPFYISLVILSLGTNLPEITLAFRSIMSGKKDVAFGDYLGSAAANGLLFGIFTLMTKDPVLQVDSFVVMFVIMLIGLGLFYYFSKTKHTISSKEGLALLLIYAIFVYIELSV